jgi:hypothetical protein
MASGLSAGQDLALMNHQVGISQNTIPGFIYISLHTAQLGNNKVAASEWTTVNSGYARILAGTNGSGIGAGAWSVAAFANGTGVVATNATQVAFPAASGSAYPITLFAVGFFSAITAGNLLFFADLATSQSIASTIIVAFFVNDISFTLN